MLKKRGSTEHSIALVFTALYKIPGPGASTGSPLEQQGGGQMVDIFMENCCREHMFGANMEHRFENVSYAAPGAVVQTKNPRVPIGHLSTGAVCNWCNFSRAGGSAETDGCRSRDPRFGWGCHCRATTHGAAEELGLGGRF